MLSQRNPVTSFHDHFVPSHFVPSFGHFVPPNSHFVPKNSHFFPSVPLDASPLEKGEINSRAIICPVVDKRTKNNLYDVKSWVHIFSGSFGLVVDKRTRGLVVSFLKYVSFLEALWGGLSGKLIVKFLHARDFSHHL